MTLWSGRNQPNLDAWLDVATRGLCVDARERIGEEVSSHYEDALSEARGAGLVEDVARARAVHSLGNPRRARRRLRREHLTKRESRVMSRMQSDYLAASRIFDIPPLPPKTRRVVSIIVALPFILVGSILGIFALTDEGLSTTVRESLPAFGMVGFLIFISVSFVYAGRFSHKRASAESIGQRARRTAFSNGASAVFGFLLTIGLVIAGIFAWHHSQEFYESRVASEQERAQWYEELKSHPLAPPDAESSEIDKGLFSQQAEILRDYEQQPASTPERPTVDWMFFVLLTYFGVRTSVYLVSSIWHARFASKLYRLGYTDPPSASC